MWPGSSCSKGRFLHEATTSNPQATGQASGKQPSRLMNSLLRMVSNIILGFRCLHLLGLCRFGVGFRLFTATQVPAEKIECFWCQTIQPQSLQVIKIPCWDRRFPQDQRRGRTTCAALVKGAPWKSGIWVFW